jgi:hypothetical protein
MEILAMIGIVAAALLIYKIVVAVLKTQHDFKVRRLVRAEYGYDYLDLYRHGHLSGHFLNFIVEGISSSYASGASAEDTARQLNGFLRDETERGEKILNQ